MIILLVIGVPLVFFAGAVFALALMPDKSVTFKHTK